MDGAGGSIVWRNNMIKQVCWRDKALWHKWWAWYPVVEPLTMCENTFCYKWAWFEWVWAKEHGGYGGSCWEYYVGAEKPND